MRRTSHNHKDADKLFLKLEARRLGSYTPAHERHFPTIRAGAKDNDADTVTPHGNVATKTKPETKKPSMYKVFLMNDDYTPMEFVVQVLETFFNKSREDATRIMLHVHQKGLGLCGVYTYEVAETKVGQVLSAARQAQHPLQCTMEKE